MIKFTIPTPCHEDWNKMITNNQGAFCGSCQKNVIDFTTLSDEEVLNYLKNNLHKQTCGRIEIKQLHRINLLIDNNILYSNISTWKKYLALILICFGTMIMGCNNKRDSQIQGKMKLEPIEMAKKEDKIIKPNPTEVKGKVESISPPSITAVGLVAPMVVQGAMEVVYVENDSLQNPTIDSTKSIITTKMDTIILKDSLKVKPDTCVSNSFISN